MSGSTSVVSPLSTLVTGTGGLASASGSGSTASAGTLTVSTGTSLSSLVLARGCQRRSTRSMSCEPCMLFSLRNVYRPHKSQRTSSLALETRLGVDGSNLGIGGRLGLSLTLQDVPGSSTVVVPSSTSTVGRVGLVVVRVVGGGLGARDLSGGLGGSGGGGLGSGDLSRGLAVVYGKKRKESDMARGFGEFGNSNGGWVG